MPTRRRRGRVPNTPDAHRSPFNPSVGVWGVQSSETASQPNRTEPLSLTRPDAPRRRPHPARRPCAAARTIIVRFSPGASSKSVARGKTLRNTAVPGRPEILAGDGQTRTAITPGKMSPPAAQTCGTSRRSTSRHNRCNPNPETAPGRSRPGRLLQPAGSSGRSTIGVHLGFAYFESTLPPDGPQ